MALFEPNAIFGVVQLTELKSNIRQFHGNLLGVAITGAQKVAMPIQNVWGQATKLN